MTSVIPLAFILLTVLALRRTGMRRQAPLVVAWIGAMVALAVLPALHGALATIAGQQNDHTGLVRFLGFLVLLIIVSLLSVAWDERRKARELRGPSPAPETSGTV